MNTQHDKPTLNDTVTPITENDSTETSLTWVGTGVDSIAEQMLDKLQEKANEPMTLANAHPVVRQVVEMSEEYRRQNPYGPYGRLSAFNRATKNTLQDPMFLGNGVNVVQFAENKYPEIQQWLKLQFDNFWRAVEINLAQDRVDFANLSEHEKHIFISNLKYQTLLDSDNGRSPLLALLSIVNLPELEAWVQAWGAWETCIHSDAYSHIIRNVVPDPSVVFNGIIDSPEIMARAEAIAKYQDKMIHLVSEYDHYRSIMTGDQPNRFNIPSLDLQAVTSSLRQEIKREALVFFFVTIMLEMVRFYLSFSCSFAFANGKRVMVNNANIIKSIARDEVIHGKVAIFILNTLRSGREGEDYVGYWEELKPTFKQIALDVFEQESAWGKYLFQYGTIIGLNQESSDTYVKYLINQVMEALDLESPFEKVIHPYPWMKGWLDSDTIQVAPQDMDNTAYTIAADANITTDDIDDLSKLLG